MKVIGSVPRSGWHGKDDLIVSVSRDELEKMVGKSLPHDISPGQVFNVSDVFDRLQALTRNRRRLDEAIAELQKCQEALAPLKPCIDGGEVEEPPSLMDLVGLFENSPVNIGLSY